MSFLGYDALIDPSFTIRKSPTLPKLNMKIFSLLVALTAPLAAHAWTGHVYSTMAECTGGCAAKVSPIVSTRL